MTITHIIAFNIALLVAILSPGPAMLVSFQTSATAGRMAGILLGLGLGSVAALWTGLALLGLDGIFTLVPGLYVSAKIAGALYLIYLAWGMWRGSSKPISKLDETISSKFFWRGVFVNLLNPKSVLFAAAVLITIFPPNMSAANMMFVVFNQLVVEVFFYSLFAVVLSVQTIQSRFLRAKIYLDRFAAIVLGTFGLRLLVSR